MILHRKSRLEEVEWQNDCFQKFLIYFEIRIG